MVAGLILGLALPHLLAADPDPAPPESEPRARLTVSGLGWIENLKFKDLLRQLRPHREAPPAYDADFIEDGAFLLLNHAHRLGYLRARIAARLTLVEGRIIETEWQEADPVPLPRPLAARELEYRLEPGLRYYYQDLQFEGLDPAEVTAFRGYFVRTDGLLKTRQLRRFSPDELDDAIDNLRTELLHAGYAQAAVTVARLEQDDATGAVRVTLRIVKGPLHRLRRIRVSLRETASGPILLEETRADDRPLSPLSREDLEQALLEESFREGYPDATVRLVEDGSEPGGPGEVLVDLRADIVRGPRVRLGTVRFESPVQLRGERWMRRRAHLDGPWLDRLEADEARSRLARLGGFRFVRLRLEPAPEDPETRDAVFELEPGKLLTVDVLAGYRSYDLLYGGFDLIRRNLFGAGHVAELRAVQSFKSTEAYLTYSIPDAFAEGLTVYGLAELLVRDEISFRREEVRSGVGLRKTFGRWGQQAGIRYSYEVLRAGNAPTDIRLQPPADPADPSEQPDVGALVFDWTVDRRDSPLTPRAGFRVNANFELALPELGGDSKYVRPDIGASWHVPLGHGRFLHLGARQTLIVGPDDAGRIPFNKRIFPGGEDSVRGYQRGEASPRNAAGEEIGAETALVWNLELEQLLTPSWSVVGFADGVAEAALIDRFPWDEVLWSVGAGIRWNSFIGPVRLEYGYNLDRRQDDPAGTLHFSVGFPF